jgi:hypothetical protein
MPFKQTAPIRACVLALALSAALAAGAVRSAQAAQTNLAYDELTRFLGADKPAPVPGSFSTEFQAAVDAQKPATQHHGLFGGLQNMADSAKNAMNMFKLGIPSRHAFMNGWERTDDLGAQTATIVKPDRHQIITLNLAKKTYRIVDTSVQPPSETPPPYQPPPNPQAPPPSPQPGTGKLDISVSSSSLGSKTIENVSTTGYSQDFKMTATQSTGSCRDGSFGTSMVEYLSDYPEPQLASTVSRPHQPTAMPPSAAMMGMHPGCNPKTTTHHSGGVTPPNGRFAMWTFVTLKGSAQTNQGQMGGGFSTLIERGDVRTLGSADASLFEVPADFTKEQ